MKHNTVKVKERYNWPVTILLIIGIVVVILLPLYMALMIAIKDPSDMNNILAFPKKIRLQNFADAWVMTDFPRKFFNTAFITARRANSSPLCITILSVPCLFPSR